MSVGVLLLMVVAVPNGDTKRWVDGVGGNARDKSVKVVKTQLALAR